MTRLLPSVLLVSAGAAGSVLLRRAWEDRERERSALRTLGWGIFLGVLIASGVLIGPMLGLAFALTLLPVGGLLVVANGATWRVAREPRRAQLAPEPLEGPSLAWRGWLKAMLAGPLGMLAAMGLAFCYASWAPGAIQSRLLIAALLVPALWGLAMTWTLADQRIVRATAVLAGTTLIGFGFAFLGGIA